VDTKKLEVSWNKFARLMVQLKRAWEDHQELWLTVTSQEREALSPEFQRVLSRNFNQSRFEIMLPRIIDYYRAYGGIETLVVPVPKEKEKKKEEGGKR
jgi:hypothetical protein